VISASSNSRLYNLLFGDSSYIVNYLRFVGWTLNKVEQTGSNFGTNQKHENPFLCDIGSGTLVSDGLSMINMHLSSSSFRLSKVSVGERNYLGNDIHYPPDGKTGANCLLGTKVLVPIDGPVRENVGLLGSPSFEIPRVVERDKNISTALNRELRRQRVGMKNRHNIVTVAIFLALNWFFFFVSMAVLHTAVMLYPQYGLLSLFVAGTLLMLAAICFYALIERASLGFKRLQPKIASVYDPYFWRHERHWKLSDSPIVSMFGGTPFKNMVSRLLGARIGRKVYDGGCSMTERSLVEIGDYANLGEGSILQGHSLEEGVFKSDLVRIGDGCSLGCAAFVHYGVRMGKHVVLEPDSFLMKGEMPDANTVWQGNPAKMIGANAIRIGVAGAR
jgi:non-ribosomal peptide synthetase-like protein